MALPTLVELAEVGAHFGHHRSLIYPKSKNFVYLVKNNVAIINLEKTQEALLNAQKVFAEYKEAGKPILFVGTRRSVRSITKEVAIAAGCHFVTERWFGGMLTNFSTMLENISRMNEQVKYLGDEKSKKLTKKERLMQENKLARSRRFLEGIAELKEMPALIILASASEDKIAIEEANQVGVPIISITDTDINPEMISYPIPANDDSPRAVQLILSTVVAAPETLKEEPAKKSAPKAPTAKAATKKVAVKKVAPKKKAEAKPKKESAPAKKTKKTVKKEA